MTAGDIRPRRRVLAALVLLAQAACMGPPRPVPEPQPFLETHSPKKIWVELTSGEQMIIEGPKVYGDSLLGFTEKEGTTEEVWLPLSDFREVRTRHLSGARTAALVGAIGVAAGLVIISIPSGGGNVIRPCMNEGVPCEDA